MRDTVSMSTQVLALLNDLDPYGLEPGEPGGAPRDEYGPEAQPLALILLNEKTVSADQVDAIWDAWFNEPLSARIAEAPFARFVARLNELA